MKFLIAVIFLFPMLFGCVENSKEVSKNKVTDSTAVFGNPDFQLPEISESVKTQIIQWGVFEDFLREAKKVNGSNYEELRIGSERLLDYSDSLVKKIPDTLNTKPINSRLTVVKTRVAMLHQLLLGPRYDSISIQQNVHEFNMAMRNLIVQLNEKFQKDAIDFQRKDNEESELKKQKRFRDSVFKIELRDKKT